MWITHPFHPLYGKAFDVIATGHTWGEDRVQFQDEQCSLRSVPVSWTSAAPTDPFREIAKGRSLFRTTDLLRLAALVQQLKDGCVGAKHNQGLSSDVKEIMPQV